MSHSQINLLGSGSENDEQKVNLNYKEVVNDIYRYLKVIKQNNVKTERNLETKLETIITNQVNILQRLDIIDNSIKGLQDKITETKTLEDTELEALNLTLSKPIVSLEETNLDSFQDNREIDDSQDILDYRIDHDIDIDNDNNIYSNIDNDDIYSNLYDTQLFNDKDEDNKNYLDSFQDNHIEKIEPIEHTEKIEPIENTEKIEQIEPIEHIEHINSNTLTNEILADIKSLTESSNNLEPKIKQNQNQKLKKHTMMILD
jgi:hypothetical protein